MPSPKHKCATLQCNKLISASATHCRNHVPRSKEWIEKQAASIRGRKHSSSTRLKISKARSGKIEAICQWCGIVFLIKPYRLRKGHGKYCSNKCNYAARSGENSPFWNGGKDIYTCKQCGVTFERYSCYSKGDNKFCSYSCNSIYKKAKQKTQRTNIELIMAQALSNAGIDYQEQETLCNITIADFYLPQARLAIFCDGNYWHNYPHGKPRDKMQTQTLVENGYKVLRFWGSEIKSDISQCLHKIRSATC